MEKNKVLMIVIIVLLVVLLSAIGFLGFSLANFMKNNANASGGPVVVGGMPMLSPDELTLVPLEKPINTNLKTGTDDVSHNVSISLSVAVNNTDKKESPKTVASLTTSVDIVRDICLSTIRGKTYEELRRQDGQDILRQELLTRLREEFQTNLIYTVYIGDMYLE